MLIVFGFALVTAAATATATAAETPLLRNYLWSGVDQLPVDSFNLHWSTCRQNATQLLAYTINPGSTGQMWYFAAASVAADMVNPNTGLREPVYRAPGPHVNKWPGLDGRTSATLAPSVSAVASAANCSLVTWSWSTGKFGLGLENGSMWYSAQVVTPSAVEQVAQPHLIVSMGDGRVCVLGEDAVSDNAVDRNEIVCFDAVTKVAQRLAMDSSACRLSNDTAAPFARVLPSGRVVCGAWWAEPAAFAHTANPSMRMWQRSTIGSKNPSDIGVPVMAWPVELATGAKPEPNIRSEPQTIGYSGDARGTYVVASSKTPWDRTYISMPCMMNRALQLWMDPDRVYILVITSNPNSNSHTLTRLNLFYNDRRNSTVQSSSCGQPARILPLQFNYALGASIKDQIAIFPLLLTADRFVCIAAGYGLLSLDIRGAIRLAVGGDSTCVADLNTDPNHCGLCKTACNVVAGQTCTQGLCVSSVVPSPVIPVPAPLFPDSSASSTGLYESSAFDFDPHDNWTFLVLLAFIFWLL